MTKSPFFILKSFFVLDNIICRKSLYADYVIEGKMQSLIKGLSLRGCFIDKSVINVFVPVDEGIEKTIRRSEDDTCVVLFSKKQRVTLCKGNDF